MLLLIGVALIFVPFNFPFAPAYQKAIGICFCMFSLYLVSSKLHSKESRDNQNLKF